MNIHLHTRSTSITTQLEDFIETSITKALRNTEPIKADVHIKQNTRHNHGEIYDLDVTVQLPGKSIHAGEHGAHDIRSGVHALVKKLEKQIIKFKEK